MRSDPRVREALYVYRKYGEAFVVDRTYLEDGRPFGYFAMFHPGLKGTLKSDLLNKVIETIAKAYREVTRRSPLTTDPMINTRPFYGFAQELFNREGLDPPSTYEIKQATDRQTTNPPKTKKNKFKKNK